MSQPQGSGPHPSPRGHANEQYEDDFTAAIERIKIGLRNVRAGNGVFGDVRVLSLTWANDDLNVGGLENQLLQIFRNTYYFNTDRYVIHPSPTQGNPTRNLTNRIVSFGQKGERADLGSLNPGRYVSWRDAVSPLAYVEETRILYILDSCEAGAASVNKSPFAEYLGGAAWGQIASSNLTDCLTRRLVDLLRSNNGRPMTVAGIHARLINQAHDPDTQMSVRPFHTMSIVYGESITLATQIGTEVEELQRLNYHGKGRALVKVSLKGIYSIPDIQQRIKWLSQEIPSQLADIQIVASFDSSSELTLMTIPIELWSALQSHPAYSLVGYIFSENKVLEVPRRQQQQQPQQQQLTLRPRSSGAQQASHKENEPFDGSSLQKH